jgi:DNA-binding NarL/FixJ family response regulator
MNQALCQVVSGLRFKLEWTKPVLLGIPLRMKTPIRLLIADDSAIVRRAICVLLQAQADIAVCGEACDYTDLLKTVSTSAADVILMDIRMPGEKLFEAATIKGHLQGSCLLAMSFANDEDTVTLAKEYGALKLLDKMELASTLLPAIEECLQQNRRAHHA